MQTRTKNNQGFALRRSTKIAIGLSLIGLTPFAFAQSEDDEDDVFELSPFEVTGEENTGYRANSTLAGTRIRTDLKDVGSAISVYTEEFLEDLGSTDSGSLLQYTTSGEVAGMEGTYSAAAGGTASDDSDALRNPNTANRIRGLGGADNTRDYFATDIPWDSYMVNRVDVLRGANSMLFGLGSPAGIVNATLSDAAFQNEGKAQLRYGSYGSLRTNVSLNKVLIEDELAIRVGALREDLGYQQEPAFEEDTRFYTALRWEPKLFGDGATTTLRAKYENGDIESNKPRTTPPQDSISPWFRTLGRDDTSNPFGGLGKFSTDNLADAYELFSDNKELYAWQSSIAGAQAPFLTFNGSTGEMYDAKGGFINNGAIGDDGQAQGAAAGIEGVRYSNQIYGLSYLSGVALNGQFPFYEYGLYRSPNLMDSSVFNFYDTLIDGDNKREFSDWDALNLDLSQTWLDNRLGVNISYDKQDFHRGGDSLMGWGPRLNVDITQSFQDGTANPNYGRPFVSTSGGNGSSYTSARETKRMSAYGELRASDFMDSDSLLTRILGKHLFNVVDTNENYEYENLEWRRKVASQAWQGYWNNNDGSTVPIADRAPTAIIYLGDSVAGASSSAGLNVPGIQSQIDWQDFPVQLFDAVWQPQAGVSWDDPWEGGANYYMSDGLWSQEVPEGGWQQRSNPANYKAWNRDTTIGVRSYNMGENTDLLSKAQMNQREISSQAANWQGFFWNDSIVATLGWRKDEVKSRAATANDAGSSQTGILNLDPNADIDRPYRFSPYTAADIFEDETVSKGVVVHLNKLLPDSPLPINVSMSYNKSANFQVAEVRRDVYGNSISNPSGDTEDFGITLATKDGKYSFRAIKYESTSNNASANLNGSSNIGSAIANGLAWRNVFLYDLGGYDWESRDQSNYRNRLSNAYDEWNGRSLFIGEGDDKVVDEVYQMELEDQMIGEWNEIQGWLDNKGFFDAWNFSPVPLEYLTTRSVYEASLSGDAPRTPASQFIPPPESIGTYGTRTAPSGFAVTGDVVAKGYEFELTANPTDNLRISFNASKSEVINSNIGGETLTELVDYLDARINANTLAGAQPRWGNPGGAVHRTWSSFMSGYKLMKLQEGTASPELRKWRYSTVANYTFSDGKLSGLNIGGSYRWQDKVAIGYPLVPIDDIDYTFDVNNPIYGPSEDFIDLWASYKFKLNDRVDWKIQLNIKNVGAGDDLIPIAIQPYVPGQTDLTYASARIAPTQNWFITNTFEF